MYQNPINLQQFSNREDLILSMGIYDDDTFDPIDLTRASTANGQTFTGGAWTVTDGAIVTSSMTAITIPAYPVNAQLTALALTVGTGLAIKAGDPITIKDTASGKNTMAGYVTSYAGATGALVVQIGFTFQFEIRNVGPGWQPGAVGYTSWYDFGHSNQEAIIKASLADYISIIDMGILQIGIPESIMRGLRADTYGCGLTMTDGVATRQIFIATLPILWGGVSN
jgi:hypothetical protein